MVFHLRRRRHVSARARTEADSRQMTHGICHASPTYFPACWSRGQPLLARAMLPCLIVGTQLSSEGSPLLCGRCGAPAAECPTQGASRKRRKEAKMALDFLQNLLGGPQQQQQTQ